MESNGHHWDEGEAVYMLEQLGVVVRYATNDGEIPIPDVQQLHAEIVRTHDEKDFASYLKAL